MSDFFMSVTKGQNAPGTRQTCNAVYSGLWLAKGDARVDDRLARRNEGLLVKSGDDVTFEGQSTCDWVRFDITQGSPSPDALLSAAITLPAQPKNAACLLRLDQVNFPSGATAFRHVHPGDGIRFLVDGELRIIGDTHTETATVGSSWFESAHSPVRAEASTDFAQTSFIRFMVLPAVYVGKPTIHILDEADARRPRKQVTQRHIDELAYLSSG